MVNLAENRIPRKIVPTNKANVWCLRCGRASYFANECNLPAHRRIHYVNPKEEVYYTIPKEEEDEVVAPIFQVHPTYRRKKTPQQPMRTNIVLQPVLTRSSQGMVSQTKYPSRP